MSREETVSLRRKNLQRWIDREHYGKQADFIAKHDLNQGEVSGLLRSKSFGEVKARNLELKCEMPPNYLDTEHDQTETSLQSVGEPEATYVTIQQYKDVRGAMGKGAYLLDVEGEVVDWRVTPQWVNSNLPANTGVKNLRIITGLGDSMKGMFNSGDPLVVDTGIRSVDFDAVYFFRVGGEGFVKLLQRVPGEGIRVKSKNPDYDTWVIREDMDLEVFGRVLKVWEGKDL